MYISHDVPFSPTKTLRLYPNVYWLNPHLSRISVTVHSNLKPDFVNMSMKPPLNHEIVYANSQSWWFKTKFNGQTPFLQYNTIQSSYLTEPWEIAHSIGFTHDKMVIFHSKLWISQRISFCIPLYPIKSRKKSPKSGEKMSILSFKSTKNWWRYVNMSILSQQKCLWPLPPIVSVSTSQGLPAPESASAAPAAPSPAAWPGSAAPPDARPGRTLRCQERWDITVT